MGSFDLLNDLRCVKIVCKCLNGTFRILLDLRILPRSLSRLHVASFLFQEIHKRLHFKSYNEMLNSLELVNGSSFINIYTGSLKNFEIIVLLEFCDFK